MRPKRQVPINCYVVLTMRDIAVYATIALVMLKQKQLEKDLNGT